MPGALISYRRIEAFAGSPVTLRSTRVPAGLPRRWTSVPPSVRGTRAMTVLPASLTNTAEVPRCAMSISTGSAPVAMSYTV